MCTLVTVNWKGQRFEVDLNKDDSPMTFKAQLFALTGVQPSRQKIMFKGRTVGDDTWDSFPINDLQTGSQFMMMGSADVVPEKPKDKTLFVEEMTDAQLNKAMEMPVGLKNLGKWTLHVHRSIFVQSSLIFREHLLYECDLAMSEDDPRASQCSEEFQGTCGHLLDERWRYLHTFS